MKYLEEEKTSPLWLYSLVAAVFGFLLGNFYPVFNTTDEDEVEETPETLVSAEDVVEVAAVDEIPEKEGTKANTSRRAIVLPKSTFVIRGDRYEANVVLADVDTSKTFFINGDEFLNGRPYEFVCASVGTHYYDGYVVDKDENGVEVRYPFKAQYLVADPNVTISTDIMLAGQANDLYINTPGIPSSDVVVSVSNATIVKKKNDRYVVLPINLNSPCDVVVCRITDDGKKQMIGHKVFKVVKK